MVSDPVLGQMTKPRWLFEAWQLKMAEEQKNKTITIVGEQALKGLLHILVSVLGLNMEPIGESDAANPSGKPVYHWPKDGEFTPLIWAIARHDYLKSAMEKVEEIMDPDKAVRQGGIDTPDHELSDDELGYLDDAMDVDEERALWQSKEIQGQLRAQVILKDPKTVDPLAPVEKQPRPEGITVKDRAAWEKELAERTPGRRPSFTIDEPEEDDLKGSWVTPDQIRGK